MGNPFTWTIRDWTHAGGGRPDRASLQWMGVFNRKPIWMGNRLDGKMITVGTPGLGVRHPHGVLSRFYPDGFSLVFSTHFLEGFGSFP
jgi:hypothetical protein